MSVRPLALLLAVAFALVCGRAHAEPVEPLRLALIIGVNRSVDKSAAPLRYADDDAARYFDLFSTLGVSSELLARPDDNTRRLHEDAARMARPPVSRELDVSVGNLAARAAAAHAEGRRVVLYVLYAGHGNVENGVGFVSLEDARLTGKDLEQRVLGAVKADQAHLVVDACHSYFLAYSRGPGGKRRKLADLGGFLTLGQRTDVGVLLSTSSARESHEWERVQSGVFSHEVRSGLYGAADADRDGVVSYREIAAFVARANQSIPNERFRPEVYAHPPKDDGVLLDLRGALTRRIEVPGVRSGHYQLENQFGTYLVEFHNDLRQGVHLVRPRAPGRLYLARVRDDQELVIDGGPDVVDTGALALTDLHSRARGAEHEAFSRVFELPFGPDTVARFRYPAPPVADEGGAGSERFPLRTVAGFGFIGLGAASGAVGVVGLSKALGAFSGGDESQRGVEERNRKIRSGNTMAGIGFTLGVAFAASGVAILVWPDAPVAVTATAGPSTLGGGIRGSF